MKLVSLEDLLAAFLEEPTCSGFLRVREHLLADEHFASHAGVVDGLAKLVAQRRAAAALAAADELMPAWGLCPRVHFLAGQAAEMLGDAAEVELRRFLVSSCIDGILSTGRGTRRSPYLATYPSDVPDLLMARGLTAKSQQLVAVGDRRLCRVITQTGPAVWFDVSEIFASCSAAEAATFRRVLA